MKMVMMLSKVAAEILGAQETTKFCPAEGFVAQWREGGGAWDLAPGGARANYVVRALLTGTPGYSLYS